MIIFHKCDKDASMKEKKKEKGNWGLEYLSLLDRYWNKEHI